MHVSYIQIDIYHIFIYIKYIHICHCCIMHALHVIITTALEQQAEVKQNESYCFLVMFLSKYISTCKILVCSDICPPEQLIRRANNPRRLSFIQIYICVLREKKEESHPAVLYTTKKVGGWKGPPPPSLPMAKR